MKLIGYEEAAQKLGVKKGTLYSWVSRQVGPPFIRLSGRSVRFDEDRLDEWLKARANAAASSKE